MPTLEQAALSDAERRVLERFVERIAEDPELDVRSVWLYGSRARGERHEESDIDVLVVTPNGRDDRDRLYALLDPLTAEEGFTPFLVSLQVWDPEWLENRREIKSFFMQEVDRDKIVLAGEP
jgi:predicted nucleotidyltransferase